MKAVKYIFIGLGSILALSNFGGLIQGFGSPILWILMFVFFGIGIAIKSDKK